MIHSHNIAVVKAFKIMDARKDFHLNYFERNKSNPGLTLQLSL
jgi:hypothetical protein